MSGRSWSKEDEATLAELVAAGYPYRRIGAILRRSEQAISNRARKLGVSNYEASKLHAAHAAKRAWADPVKRQEAAGKIRASWTPERRAAQSARAKETTRLHPQRPPSEEGKARRVAAVRTYFAKRRAWIPDDLMPEFVRLRRNIGAEPARAKIRAMIEERRSRLSPFERALERVRNGAGIIDRPIIRQADPLFTLGGVSEII